MIMKKEKTNEPKAEYTQYSDEEQALDLNELMDVQGGVDDKDVPNCGLGCYIGGFTNTTETENGKAQIE